jgi:hypothetical protein
MAIWRNLNNMDKKYSAYIFVRSAESFTKKITIDRKDLFYQYQFKGELLGLQWIYTENGVCIINEDGRENKI